MYAKFAKENHAEMYGAKLETFNEAKVIFHQWENVFAADQKTSMLAMLLGSCDAPQRRSGLRQERDTDLADDRRMEPSGGNFACVIPNHRCESRILSVRFLDRVGGVLAVNLSKAFFLPFICVRV